MFKAPPLVWTLHKIPNTSKLRGAKLHYLKQAKENTTLDKVSKYNINGI